MLVPPLPSLECPILADLQEKQGDAHAPVRMRKRGSFKGRGRHDLCPQGVYSVPGEGQHLPVSALRELRDSPSVLNTEHGARGEGILGFGWPFGGGS